MKKLSMTKFELKSLTRKDIDQFAVAVKDDDNIDAKNGVVIYNEYIDANKNNDEFSFQEVLDWYIEMKNTQDYVILRVFDGGLWYVEIE